HERRQRTERPGNTFVIRGLLLIFADLPVQLCAHLENTMADSPGQRKGKYSSTGNRPAGPPSRHLHDGFTRNLPPAVWQLCYASIYCIVAAAGLAVHYTLSAGSAGVGEFGAALLAEANHSLLLRPGSAGGCGVAGGNPSLPAGFTAACPA